MIRGMGHMLFPRYIQRETRDFFYLTSRPILPGAPLTMTSPWRTKGLPQHGFPYALETTTATDSELGSEVKLYVVRADPRALAPADRGSGDAPTVLALVEPGRGSLTLWWAPGLFAVAPTPPNSEAVPLAGGDPLAGRRATSSRAALGVYYDGILAWVKLPADAEANVTTARAMAQLPALFGPRPPTSLLADPTAPP